MTQSVSKEAPQDVAALRTVAEAATGGEWTPDAEEPGAYFIPSPSRFRGQIRWTNVVYSDNSTADAAYIAAASPDVVLGLLDREAQVVAMLDYWLASLDVYDGIDWKAEFTAARDLLRGSGAEEAARDE